MLLDGGCELHGYCSDVTRTWPTQGRFRCAPSQAPAKSRGCLPVVPRFPALRDDAPACSGALHGLRSAVAQGSTSRQGRNRRAGAPGAWHLAPQRAASVLCARPVAEARRAPACAGRAPCLRTARPSPCVAFHRRIASHSLAQRRAAGGVRSGVGCAPRLPGRLPPGGHAAPAAPPLCAPAVRRDSAGGPAPTLRRRCGLPLPSRLSLPSSASFRALQFRPAL